VLAVVFAEAAKVILQAGTINLGLMSLSTQFFEMDRLRILPLVWGVSVV